MDEGRQDIIDMTGADEDEDVLDREAREEVMVVDSADESQPHSHQTADEDNPDQQVSAELLILGGAGRRRRARSVSPDPAPQRSKRSKTGSTTKDNPDPKPDGQTPQDLDHDDAKNKHTVHDATPQHRRGRGRAGPGGPGRYFVDDELLCKICGLRGHFDWECREEEPQIRCHTCGQTGHVSRECQSQSCFRCGQMGHVARECPNSNTMPGVAGGARWDASANAVPFIAKRIRETCFVCGAEGHLMCTQTGVRALDGIRAPHCCYNCGDGGHVGPACPLPDAETTAKWARNVIRELLGENAPGDGGRGGRRRGASSILKTLNEEETKQFWQVFNRKVLASAQRDSRLREAFGSSQWQKNRAGKPFGRTGDRSTGIHARLGAGGGRGGPFASRGGHGGPRGRRGGK